MKKILTDSGRFSLPSRRDSSGEVGLSSQRRREDHKILDMINDNHHKVFDYEEERRRVEQ